MNKTQAIGTFSTLTLLGAVPFLACALLPLAGIDALAGLGSTEAIAASYGLGIVSFITGIHWGTQLLRPETTAHNLFISSNVVFLATWFGFLALPLAGALTIQIVAFAFLAWVDRDLTRKGLHSSSYWRVRLTATLIACVSLGVIALRSL